MLLGGLFAMHAHCCRCSQPGDNCDHPGVLGYTHLQFASACIVHIVADLWQAVPIMSTCYTE